MGTRVSPRSCLGEATEKGLYIFLEWLDAESQGTVMVSRIDQLSNLKETLVIHGSAEPRKCLKV